MAKSLSSLLIGVFILSFLGISCKNPLSAYTKQYSCTIEGMPEPETSAEYLDRGHKHFQDNNYKSDPGDCALGACAEAIRLDPKNADAYHCRATIYRDKGEWDKALADIEEAIKLTGDNPQYFALRSLLYDDKDMFEKGLADMNRLIELTGSDTTHYDYGRRGDFYYKLNKPEEAIKDYNKAIERQPSYRYHYSSRARAYEKLGREDLAEVDDKKAFEMEILDATGGPPPFLPAGPTGSNSNRSPNTQVGSISGGVMNDKAINLPEPPYPPAARAVRATGAVNVQITVDENGNVISASAVSGHPLLRSAAVAAARSAKFKPTIANGKPTKVTGVLVFKFEP